MRKLILGVILLAALGGTALAGMITSGETAIATSGDTAVDVFTSPTAGSTGYTQVVVINEGAVAGFFSIDGGTTWARLPASSSIICKPANASVPSLKVKRVASGTNLAGIWGWAQ